MSRAVVGDRPEPLVPAQPEPFLRRFREKPEDSGKFRIPFLDHGPDGLLADEDEEDEESAQHVGAPESSDQDLSRDSGMQEFLATRIKIERIKFKQIKFQKLSLNELRLNELSLNEFENLFY